jgi:phospholipase C
LWQWARAYTLADHFFMGAFGGSFLNHFYFVCACAPRDPGLSAPGQVTEDGYVVRTAQPPYQPSGVRPAAGGPLTLADPAGTRGLGRPLAPQAARTIGDTLSAKGVSWAWYAAGWNAAVADGMQPPEASRHVIYRRGSGSPYFQPHHQPFNYFASFAPGTTARARHLLDGADFLRAIASGTLPAVSFYKPAGIDNQHPGYSDVATGDAHIGELLQMLRASPQWRDMLVIVTYDENGGYWDHVPPPAGPGWGDRFGPGTRIPAVLIGPMVKKGFVDATPYDTTSILKFLTERFGLEPLPGVRVNVGDFSNALM